jgi:alpha-ketoglutarate-dependent taurine dioxygenase
MQNVESNSQPATVTTPEQGVFSLNDSEAYHSWRDQKLNGYPTRSEALLVELGDLRRLSEAERAALAKRLNKTNIVIYKYKGKAASKADIQSLACQLGLAQLDHNLCADEDKITSLQVVDKGRHGGYIPYSDKRLSWHTDGYYNSAAQTVRAIIMHCVRPAATGGENMYLDPEILYIQLREQDPRWIEALMQANAMIIPANFENGKQIRSETRGPVFSVDQQGYLHMRYSARIRNIEWAKNGHIKKARAFITEFLASDSPYVFRYRLQTNEGVISNNVLHNRTAFKNDEQHNRLLYRARFYERVNIS